MVVGCAMSSPNIIARVLTVIQKNGNVLKYTHVTDFGTYNDAVTGQPTYYISGETEDVDGSRCKVVEHHPIADLTLSIAEFYIPA